MCCYLYLFGFGLVSSSDFKIVLSCSMIWLLCRLYQLNEFYLMTVSLVTSTGLIIICLCGLTFLCCCCFFFFTDKLLIFTLLYYELIFLLVFHLLKSINFLKWKIVLSLTIFNCQWFSECAWLEELNFISIWVLIWFNMLLINIIYFKASHFTRVFFSLIHICAYVYARQLNVTLEWNSTWKSLTLLK